MMFRALSPRHTAVDAVSSNVRRAIVDGALRPGSTIGEQALAKQFRVSRGTVRAALARLATTHLLTVHHGSGYRVENFRRRGGPELIGALIEAASNRAELPRIVADLLLIRRLLARAALERLTTRPTRDVARVAPVVEAFAEVVARGGSIEEIAAADMEVLAVILESTGSTVLQLCFNLIQDVVVSLEPLRAAMYQAPTTNVAGYRLLLGWLGHRDERDIDGLVAVLEQRDAASVAFVARTQKVKS